jgi:adenosylcobinamide kinase/adenosylcobinamide-phosphate guanylyltransferase
MGGVRSGKSAFAERLVPRLSDGPVIYLATAVPADADMARRVERHRQRRPGHWRTLEEPLDLAGQVALELGAFPAPAAVLVDSLDMWVSNLLLQHEMDSDAALESLAMLGLDRLLECCRAAGAGLVLVSSEVGLSLVPSYPLGRRFQDLLGLVNQRAAAAAQQVYLVVAGVPVELKGLGNPPQVEA